jgi:GT2 family glycosyltransferase
MNPVLILTHNCLNLTKKCVASVRAQDIETAVEIIDNGSTDGTENWLAENSPAITDDWKMTAILNHANLGVSSQWNRGLDFFFNGVHAEHVLIVNNDTILPPWFYRELLSYNLPFISGTTVDQMEQIATPRHPQAAADAPDFSAFLIRREAWQKIGSFDERMKNYYSDNDWHVRAHQAGITLWNSGIPFYHERSSTLKQASEKERRMLELQSLADEEVFVSIYGCSTWQPAYAELFQ